jgi:hypothetical protein
VGVFIASNFVRPLSPDQPKTKSKEKPDPMTAHRTITAKARRAAMLRQSMARMVRTKGRFRGALLARLAHAIGRALRAMGPASLQDRAYSSFLSVPLSALADLGLGQAGGGGGGSGRI